MALCRNCRGIIPCHCHVTPPVQVRPGVYLVDTRQQKSTAGTAQQPKEA